MILFLMSMLACGPKQPVNNAQPQNLNDDEPIWYQQETKGCNAQSVMLSKYYGDKGQAKKAAAQRARAELALQMQQNIKQMFEDYNKMQAQNGEADFVQQEESGIRALSDQSMRGTVTTQSRTMGDYTYVQVCINPEDLINALNSMDKLSAAQKEAIQRDARDFQNRMDAQLNANQAN